MGETEISPNIYKDDKMIKYIIKFWRELLEEMDDLIDWIEYDVKPNKKFNDYSFRNKRNRSVLKKTKT